MIKNLLFAAIAAVALAAPACAQKENKPRLSPADSAMGSVGAAKLAIHYSSPSVKGRTVYGEVVPYSKVWRSGANEATTFRTDKDIMVEGKSLPAGTYALFTIPEKESWTVIFNKTAKQWGAYDYKEKEDALRVTVKPRKLTTPAERLAYVVTQEGFALRWASLEVPVAVK